MFPTVKTQVNFIGGLGLKMARVMLNLEIYDEPLGGARIRNSSVTDLSDISFEVYPVPSHQLIQIRTNAKSEGSHLCIYSMEGRKLREINYQPQIDISDLCEGVYFIILSTEENKIVSKFVKN